MSHSKLPIQSPKRVEHNVSSKSDYKVNVILRNTIGPEEDIKKVRIPVNTPVQKLKEKIAELYKLDPNDFQLSHIPSSGKNSPTNPSQINITKVTKSQTMKDERKITTEERVDRDKQPVKIILKDRNGIKKFQKKILIPRTTSVGELRDLVADKLGQKSDEFHLSLEKYI